MTEKKALADWIQAAKERGGAPVLLTLLDALEPLAPVLAQGLLVAQPVAHIWRAGEAARELADLLEAPAGMRELRRLLDEDGLE